MQDAILVGSRDTGLVGAFREGEFPREGVVVVLPPVEAVVGAGTIGVQLSADGEDVVVGADVKIFALVAGGGQLDQVAAAVFLVQLGDVGAGNAEFVVAIDGAVAVEAVPLLLEEVIGVAVEEIVGGNTGKGREGADGGR